jgi:hypothetical protein
LVLLDLAGSAQIGWGEFLNRLSHVQFVLVAPIFQAVTQTTGGQKWSGVITVLI